MSDTAPVTKKNAPAAALEIELARASAYRTALRRFLLRTEKVTAKAGLTPQRYDLLLTIRSRGDTGVRITELCELLQMRQTAVTELVKRSEEAGLLVRRPSADDGRVWLLGLTRLGRSRMMRAFAALRDDRSELAAALREVDRRFRAS